MIMFYQSSKSDFPLKSAFLIGVVYRFQDVKSLTPKDLKIQIHVSFFRAA